MIKMILHDRSPSEIIKEEEMTDLIKLTSESQCYVPLKVQAQDPSQANFQYKCHCLSFFFFFLSYHCQIFTDTSNRIYFCQYCTLNSKNKQKPKDWLFHLCLLTPF